MLNRLYGRRRGQAGAATVEFYLVALFALLPLCLGMLQLSLLLVDNHHVDHAAFMAARSGSMQHGDIGQMRREFARVLTPLFVGTLENADAQVPPARVTAAHLRALAEVSGFSRIRVLTPSEAAQRDFAVLRDGEGGIPSDALEHRSVQPGAASGISVQQANVLKVEFTYCRPMVVPFIRVFLLGLLRRIDREPFHQRCYAAERVPVRSFGIAPMQSDFRPESAR